MVTMEDGDLEERKVKIKISSVEITNCYKKFEGIITVTPKNKGGSHVVWTVEFKKNHSEIEDPHSIIETCVKYFEEIDATLVKKMDEINVKERSQKRVKFDT